MEIGAQTQPKKGFHSSLLDSIRICAADLTSLTAESLNAIWSEPVFGESLARNLHLSNLNMTLPNHPDLAVFLEMRFIGFLHLGGPPLRRQLKLLKSRFGKS